MLFGELIYWLRSNKIRIKIETDTILIPSEYKYLITPQIRLSIQSHKQKLLDMLLRDWKRPLYIAAIPILAERIAVVPDHLILIFESYNGMVVYRQSELEILDALTESQIIGYHLLKKLFRSEIIDVHQQYFPENEGFYGGKNVIGRI